MLRLALTLPVRSPNLFQYAAFNSCAPINSLRPPLNLDPSLEALLREEDITLHSKVESLPPKVLRELEVVNDVLSGHILPMDEWTQMDISETRKESEHSGERKSPAALFGSQRIGMVVLPSELFSAIQQLITGMHSVKMAIIIDYTGSQTETNHKYTVMLNGYSNLT